MDNQKIPLGKKLIFGLSASANNLHIHFDTFFFTYFLTDVFGLSAAFIGTMYFITRIYDAFNDHIEGFIIDHTRTRWGRFRIYLLLVPIPLALIRIGLYAGPPFEGWAKNAYIMVLYIIGGSAASFIAIALNLLLASMTQDASERTSLSGVAATMGLTTTLIISAVTLPLVNLFPNEQTGFLVIVSIYAVIATVFYFLVFAKIKGKYEYTEESYPLNQIFSMLSKNKPLLVLCLSNLFAIRDIPIWE